MPLRLRMWPERRVQVHGAEQHWQQRYMRGNGVGTDKQVHLESPVLRGTDVVAGEWLHVDGCPMSKS